MNPRCCLLPQTERCFGKKPFCSFVFFSGAYLRALTHWLMDTFKAKCKALFSVRDYFFLFMFLCIETLSRGCFGCFIAVDDPSKPLKIRGRKAKRSSCSEDFWNSSGCEMEHSGVQSQGSISSTNASNLDPSGSTSHPSEFVNHGKFTYVSFYMLLNKHYSECTGNICLPLDNHIGEVNFLKMTILLAGLLLWSQTRQQWLGNNKSEKRVQPRQPTISWNTIYESLHGNYKSFPHPIPLPEMVDFLVDVWEQEGLYG
ncbi:hypothetical protein Gorai_011192 [Gossypium raimondii]|uniref:Gag1-like clamp domain-containing protein n=1 Tax=Gossypium raimondii TaxID=29730 RepID=A0A7J8PYT8_GOSRA|nr:hypothetical protein [Gossypium raimondii]